MELRRGQKTKRLPKGLYQVVGLQFDQAMVIWPLRYASMMTIRDLRADKKTRNVLGAPEMFAVNENKTIEFWPAADKRYKLRLTYCELRVA